MSPRIFDAIPSQLLNGKLAERKTRAVNKMIHKFTARFLRSGKLLLYNFGNGGCSMPALSNRWNSDIPGLGQYRFPWSDNIFDILSLSCNNHYLPGFLAGRRIAPTGKILRPRAEARGAECVQPQTRPQLFKKVFVWLMMILAWIFRLQIQEMWEYLLEYLEYTHVLEGKPGSRA
jgi:hypothetical protein